MSIVTASSAAAELPQTERRATPHTAVLTPTYREVTGLRTGLIAPEDVLAQADYCGVIYEGWACRATMQLGGETPFYEIAFRGRVYRMLTRPKDGEAGRPSALGAKARYELVRTVAPGLVCDGEYLARPAAVPNTPRALVNELLLLLNAPLQEILENAYSVFHYRLDHQARNPESLTPEGYTLREVFLGSVAEDGGFRTLYETPPGTNVELWTLFLRALDQKKPKLAAYAKTSMAAKEFGEAGYSAIREGLRMRALSLDAGPAMSWTRFVEAFPTQTHGVPITRQVGCNSTLL